MDLNSKYRRHYRSQGEVPVDIFSRKYAYALSHPYIRPEQAYSDFSLVWRPFQNPAPDGRVIGNQASIGKDGVDTSRSWVFAVTSAAVLAEAYERTKHMPVTPWKYPADDDMWENLHQAAAQTAGIDLETVRNLSVRISTETDHYQ